jgi:hypothetical protein
MQSGDISLLPGIYTATGGLFLLCEISKYTRVALLLILVKCEKASETVGKSLSYNAEISFFCPEFVQFEFKHC